MMRASPALASRAAATYSSSRMRINSERVSRASGGHVTRPMATAIIPADGLNSDTITMANSRGGSTWKNSVIFMSSVFVAPW